MEPVLDWKGHAKRQRNLERLIVVARGITVLMLFGFIGDLGAHWRLEPWVLRKSHNHQDVYKALKIIASCWAVVGIMKLRCIALAPPTKPGRLNW